MTKTKQETVAGMKCSVSKDGVLFVVAPPTVISVLPRGTHAALDVLGDEKKQEVVRWWKS